MNKKTILEISLYAQYYKKDITDRYMINNKSLIITNDAIDILDKPQEKLYIDTWEKAAEKDKEIERLNNIIDDLEKELKKDMDVYICGRSNGKTFNYVEKIVKAYYLNKLKELKENK